MTGVGFLAYGIISLTRTHQAVAFVPKMLNLEMVNFATALWQGHGRPASSEKGRLWWRFQAAEALRISLIHKDEAL